MVSPGNHLTQISNLAEYVGGSFSLCSFIAVGDWHGCHGHPHGIISLLNQKTLAVVTGCLTQQFFSPFFPSPFLLALQLVLVPVFALLDFQI